MFHAFAIFSTATIVPATWLILKAKKTGNKAYYVGHGITMTWSYFGLFATLVSESALTHKDFIISLIESHKNKAQKDFR